MPVKVYRATSKKTAKRMLKELRTFFRTADDKETAKLWDVLSALRGPDRPEQYIYKAATTGVIRQFVLPPRSSRRCGLTVVGDDQSSVERRAKLTNARVRAHFYSHVRDAFDALGLKWDQVNEKAPKK